MAVEDKPKGFISWATMGAAFAFGVIATATVLIINKVRQ